MFGWLLALLLAQGPQAEVMDRYIAARAVSLNNAVADFHALLGDLYEKSGDRARATQSRRRATRLDPKRKPLGR